MATWADLQKSEPDFAARVQERFDAYTHKILATLRKDGSPRISGIEASFKEGEVWLGMMPGSLKALDVLRDPRLALHSGTEDPPKDGGTPGMAFDAKLAGRAVPVTDDDPRDAGGEGGPPANYFKIDLTEVVLISLGDPGDHLLIETWNENQGLRARKRY